MNASPVKIDASELIQRGGRCFGYYLTRHGRRFLDQRCAQFPLTVSGVEHLALARDQPCLLVANHVLIRPENAPFGRWTQARPLTLLNQPPDSFILRRIVREQTGLTLYVVAKSDRGWWSPRPLVRLLQKRVGQPFGKGLLEGMEFIPIEHNPACFHRTFFSSAAGTIQRGHPILIFPGKLRDSENECRDSLVEGDIRDACILPGAAHLARKFSMPIIPVFIHGAESWRPEKPTCIVVGPAIDTEGMTKAGLNRAIIKGVRDLNPAQQGLPAL